MDAAPLSRSINASSDERVAVAGAVRYPPATRFSRRLELAVDVEMGRRIIADQDQRETRRPARVR